MKISHLNEFLHALNNYKYSLLGTHYTLDAHYTVMIETDILLLHSSKTLVKILINLDERNRDPQIMNVKLFSEYIWLCAFFFLPSLDLRCKEQNWNYHNL